MIPGVIFPLGSFSIREGDRMATERPIARMFVAPGLVLVLTALVPSPASTQGTPPATPPGRQGVTVAGQPQGRGGPNFEADMQRQATEDAVWRAASAGKMKMEKTKYKSRVGGFEVPVFVFAPLEVRGPKGHPALVWVHPDIRGHVYPYYIPYVLEAVSRGYVVVAPEYRGDPDQPSQHSSHSCPPLRGRPLAWRSVDAN